MNRQNQRSDQTHLPRNDNDEDQTEHALASWSRRHDLYGQERAEGGRDVYAEINRALNDAGSRPQPQSEA